MRRIIPVIVAGLLVAAFAAPASAGTSTWHRDNYGGGHERLVCSATSGVWQCRYDSLPISQNDQGTGDGQFRGTVSTTAWCPDWAGVVCEHATRFVVGAMIYGQNLTIWQELIFTDGDGVAPMYMYLVGPGEPFPAICPWYPTWTQAQANSYECFFD
ncbi:MAG TPA: hypothetical protein VFP19_05115 [Candidatus Limnocylindrales bacterium]|nr:hypothetical protein [Candidatus Limnocylindrales bacterium]